MKCLLLALVVCCVTINTFAHAHSDKNKEVNAAKKPKENEDDIKGPVDPEKLSPEFIKKFDPDYLKGEDDSVAKVAHAARAMDGAACLRDDHVRRMATCLAIHFNDFRFQRASVKNHLRRYIREKNVMAWFVYIGEAFKIRLDETNLAVIVSCYIDPIPT